MKIMFEATYTNKDDVTIKTEITVESAFNHYAWFKAVLEADKRLNDIEHHEQSSFCLTNVRLVGAVKESD